MKKPIKAPGARLNTWLIDVEGYQLSGLGYENKTFAVRFTSDTYETLSIADEEGNRQFIVPFEQIQEMIRHARKENKKS